MMNSQTTGNPTPLPRGHVNINSIIQGREPRTIDQVREGAGHAQVRAVGAGAFGAISANQMSRNIAMLEARCSDLSNALFSKTKDGSKNKTRGSKKDLPMTDQMNVTQSFAVTENKIMPTNPVRPLSWMKWSTNERSFCKIAMTGVKLPPGMDAKMYWETVLVRKLNNKFVFTKSNLIDHFRKRFIGNDAVHYCLFCRVVIV